jgi:hypothetical protein
MFKKYASSPCSRHYRARERYFEKPLKPFGAESSKFKSAASTLGKDNEAFPRHASPNESFSFKV